MDLNTNGENTGGGDVYNSIGINEVFA